MAKDGDPHNLTIYVLTNKLLERARIVHQEKEGLVGKPTKKDTLHHIVQDYLERYDKE